LERGHPHVRFFRNGTLAFTCTLPAGVYYLAATHCNSAADRCALYTNFGAEPFVHPVPSGAGPMRR